MSRHTTHSVYRGQPVRVVAGYDRQDGKLFLHVMRLPGHSGGGCTDRFVYDSVRDPLRDWTDINTLTEVLERRRIEVSADMVWGLYLDQCFNEGNRLVDHPPVTQVGS